MSPEEAVREAKLHEYGIFGTPPEKPFDDIAEFAAELCECPIAIVNLVGTERQWFKAIRGLDAREAPTRNSFCAHAMHEKTLMTVEDARLDPRFSAHPFVTGAPHIRFYAGVPLTSPEGFPLGALCVIDTKPRAPLNALQTQGLNVLAAQVMNMLELRRRLLRKEEEDRHLAETDQKFRLIADTMPQMVWSTTAEGRVDFYNSRWYEFTGASRQDAFDVAVPPMFHPDDRERVRRAWHAALAEGGSYAIEYRLRHHSGDYRWTTSRALPLRDREGSVTRWLGTTTDIHDTRLALEERELVAQELNHRIKNIFAVIAGLINLSARKHPEFSALAEDLRDRVTALARAHDYVRKPHGTAAEETRTRTSLHGMLGELFAPYNDAQSGRISIEGDDTEIDDRSATPIALHFHELATNAAKYGALSAPGGKVRVRIIADPANCTIQWQETGGPPVTTPPTREGFGAQLIRLSGEHQLRGTIARDWHPEGLRLAISIPLESLSRT
ncbi:PAS domain-containing protein [Sphingomonas sp. C3-2]|uniref:PAS domain-containing protein n=1 Tax=Sphingomonas sp. C3-2 TaxID=3062169 RepID=UPI00294A9B4C|nr:PAS domain-containing protein [Sphingomonas sp. C3-2]WOK37151.1 PAS domain-containing protein [Sphingomonas sp. C3-2]